MNVYMFVAFQNLLSFEKKCSQICFIFFFIIYSDFKFIFWSFATILVLFLFFWHA